MILLDDRIGTAKPEIADLTPYFKPYHIGVCYERLAAGDMAFLGVGPAGCVQLGIERKRILDLVSSMETGRLAAGQIPEMSATYYCWYLIVEGRWREHPNTGELQIQTADGNWWSDVRKRRSLTASAMMGYLHSLEVFGGVHIRWSSCPEHTARHAAWLYRWWEKPWDSHRSFKVFHDVQDKATLGKPSLVRRMAAQIDGIGWERSRVVEQKFATVEQMVLAPADDWTEYRKIGSETALRAWNALRTKGV